MPAKLRQTQWDQETRELAYEVWSLKAGRDPALASRIIATEYALDIPYRTVKQWADSVAWQQRANDEAKAYAPAMRNEAFGELIFAAKPAARYLRSVLTGDEQPNKTRVLVAFGILDRIGIAPARQPLNPADSSDDPRIALPALTPEERQRIADSLA